MKIHKGLDSFDKLTSAVVTTGTFDGVHLGHKKILKKLISIGKKTSSETVLVTFFPHPRIVLFPDHELKLINTIEENIELFKQYGIGHLIFQTFTKDFSRITALEYIRDILCQKIGLKELVIGYDHHFGRNREGGRDKLNEYAELYEFNIHEVQAHQFNDNAVSSTKIRTAINEGNLELTNDYLGYKFEISGRVIKGNGRGAILGFPTANVDVENKNKILPADGVYAVKVIYNEKTFNGMLNIGNVPTFNQGQKSIEVHIFDFNQLIYNNFIKIRFIKRIRNERKFSGVDDLKKQLSMDKITTLNIMNTIT